MTPRFNAPPNWPTPPEGFVPEADWQPDPAWGPAPEGWNFWVEDTPPTIASAQVATGATKKPKSNKGFLVLGIGLAALALIVSLVLFLVPVFSHGVSDAPQLDAANTLPSSASSLQAVESSQSPSVSPTAQASSTKPAARPSLKSTTAALDAFDKASALATDFPGPQDYPAGSYAEYTAQNVKNVLTTSSASDTNIMFGVPRLQGAENLAWVEFYFTPSSTEKGTISEQRASKVDSSGQTQTITGHEWDLYAPEAGKEYRVTFWMSPSVQGHSDIFQVHLPEGSTWKLRVHPANHAPHD